MPGKKAGAKGPMTLLPVTEGVAANSSTRRGLSLESKETARCGFHSRPCKRSVPGLVTASAFNGQTQPQSQCRGFSLGASKLDGSVSGCGIPM
jgi:hypothetical protein